MPEFRTLNLKITLIRMASNYHTHDRWSFVKENEDQMALVAARPAGIPPKFPTPSDNPQTWHLVDTQTHIKRLNRRVIHLR